MINRARSVLKIEKDGEIVRLETLVSHLLTMNNYNLVRLTIQPHTVAYTCSCHNSLKHHSHAWTWSTRLWWYYTILSIFTAQCISLHCCRAHAGTINIVDSCSPGNNWWAYTRILVYSVYYVYYCMRSKTFPYLIIILQQQGSWSYTLYI